MSDLQITRIGTVIVPVDDQDTALAFYTETLGFETRLDAPLRPGMRWIEVSAPGVPRDMAPAGIEVSLATRSAAGDHSALLARRVDADPELIEMGEGVPPMFTFRDGDGNRFRMVERE